MRQNSFHSKSLPLTKKVCDEKKSETRSSTLIINELRVSFANLKKSSYWLKFLPPLFQLTSDWLWPPPPSLLQIFKIYIFVWIEKANVFFVISIQDAVGRGLRWSGKFLGHQNTHLWLILNLLAKFQPPTWIWKGVMRGINSKHCKIHSTNQISEL